MTHTDLSVLLSVERHQEQRDADLRVREIRLRYEMLKLVSSGNYDTMESNQAAAKNIYEAFKDDAYFNDVAPGMIQEENIQTLGYMKTFRQLFDLLDTVDKVTRLHYILEKKRFFLLYKLLKTQESRNYEHTAHIHCNIQNTKR